MQSFHLKAKVTDLNNARYPFWCPIPLLTENVLKTLEIPLSCLKYWATRILSITRFYSSLDTKIDDHIRVWSLSPKPAMQSWTFERTTPCCLATLFSLESSFPPKVTKPQICRRILPTGLGMTQWLVFLVNLSTNSEIANRKMARAQEGARVTSSVLL